MSDSPVRETMSFRNHPSHRCPASVRSPWLRACYPHISLLPHFESVSRVHQTRGCVTIPDSPGIYKGLPWSVFLMTGLETHLEFSCSLLRKMGAWNITLYVKKKNTIESKDKITAGCSKIIVRAPEEVPWPLNWELFLVQLVLNMEFVILLQAPPSLLSQHGESPRQLLQVKR